MPAAPAGAVGVAVQAPPPCSPHFQEDLAELGADFEQRVQVAALGQDATGREVVGFEGQVPPGAAVEVGGTAEWGATRPPAWPPRPPAQGYPSPRDHLGAQLCLLLGDAGAEGAAFAHPVGLQGSEARDGGGWSGGGKGGPCLMHTPRVRPTPPHHTLGQCPPWKALSPRSTPLARPVIRQMSTEEWAGVRPGVSVSRSGAAGWRPIAWLPTRLPAGALCKAAGGGSPAGVQGTHRRVRSCCSWLWASLTPTVQSICRVSQQIQDQSLSLSLSNI